MHWGHSVVMRGERFKLTRAEWLAHYEQEVPKCPEPPPGADHIWPIWNRLRARTGNGDGVSPITFESIDAFVRLTGEAVTQSDIVMLEAMDDAFISQVSIERAEQAERQRQELEARQ